MKYKVTINFKPKVVVVDANNVNHAKQIAYRKCMPQIDRDNTEIQEEEFAPRPEKGREALKEKE